MRVLLLLISLLCWSNFLFSQDASFSQFYHVGHWYNPARVGSMEQDIKAGIHYRNQWAANLEGYRTNGFNVEARARKAPFSMGLLIVDDKSGNASLKTFQALVSSAYRLEVNRSQTLTAGFQLGLVQRSIQMEDLRWDKQYNGYQYDPTIDSGERQFSDRTGNKIDLGMGVFYTFEKPVRAGVGYAFHHLGQDQTFLQNGKDRLPIRQSMQGYIERDFDRFGGRLDALVQRQRGAMEYLVNFKTEYRFGYDSKYTTENNSSAIYVGCGYRHASAIIPSMGFEWERKLEISVSYDIVFSRLSEVTTFGGGPEIGLIYKYRMDKRMRIR